MLFVLADGKERYASDLLDTLKKNNSSWWRARFIPC